MSSERQSGSDASRAKVYGAQDFWGINARCLQEAVVDGFQFPVPFLEGISKGALSIQRFRVKGCEHGELNALFMQGSGFLPEAVGSFP